VRISAHGDVACAVLAAGKWEPTGGAVIYRMEC
jgi:hypothetical protein